MIRLAIFDLDGTLIDSITDIAISFNAALRAHGLPEHPLGEYKRMVGGNLEQVVARILPQDVQTDDVIDRVKTLYRQLYRESPKENTRPYPGIAALLDELVRRGVLLAVNTNKSQALTEQIMEKLFSPWPFCAVAGYREDAPSKPDPAAVNAILATQGILPQEAVYIGDGETDIATADNAGLPMVFVTWGQGEANREDARVAKFVGEPHEIMKFILQYI